MKRSRLLARLVAWALLGVACGTAPEAPPISDPVALYAQRCAGCHDAGVERAPTRAEMQGLAPEDVAAALTRGSMRAQAEGLERAQIRGLAEHLTGKRFGLTRAAPAKENPCTEPAPALQLADGQWNGWGRDLENTRYQPSPGLSAADLPRLAVKWAYAYPGRSAYGQPTIVGDRVYVTSATGRVSALDAKTGCERWTYEAGSGVKSAVVVGALASTEGTEPQLAAFFGDEGAHAHAVDARTGERLWKTKLDDHVAARVTGSPVFHAGRLYVPLSSYEEPAAANPKYPCCTFRGSIVALDARSGERVWKSHSIREEPRPFRTSTAGTQMYGPAGGAIWSSPTVDPARGLVYAATGNSYTDVDTDGADAIVAFDLATGERKWANQVTPDDNFVLRCGPGNRGQDNCPEDAGPDFDFGSPPMLKTLSDGKQVLLASQKSGVVYALDADAQGKLLWQAKVGQGSALGGVQWGPGADAEHIYVAISDVAVGDGTARPGLSALRIATGEQLWSTPTPSVECAWGKRRCARGQSAAVTVIPGVVFSGALDGHIRAYAAKDGSIVWDFDTAARSFETVNGLELEGGSIDGGGATIADGVLYVNSGYGRSRSARLLLALSVGGK